MPLLQVNWNHEQGNRYLNNLLVCNQEEFHALATNNEFQFNIDQMYCI